MDTQQALASDVEAEIDTSEIATEVQEADPLAFYKEGEGEEAPETEGEQVEDGEIEAIDEELPAIDMPKSWGKDDAAAWSGLPRETQEVVSRREAERDRFVREAGRKAAETRHSVENETRQIIAKQAEDHAVALQQYARLFVPQQPDQSLLYTGNPDDVLKYQRQDAAYRAGVDQQQALHQQIAQAQQQANAARQQAGRQETQVDAQRLADQLPEWFDPSEGPKLQAQLQSIGAELGYPVELMAEASSVDILALKKAADWKADAEKYRKLMGKKMSAVRAARQLPKIARPGAVPAKAAESDPLKTLYPND